ncbi:MAG: putative bifunctional diguanylate cyclase/phosphodiesterase [Sphingomonadaceae bacterium]
MLYEIQIWREKLRNHAQGIVVNAAAVATLAAIVRNPAAQWFGVWTVVSLLVCAMRYALHWYCYRYQKRHLGKLAPRSLRALLGLGVITSATLWALAAWHGIPAFTDNEKFSIMIMLAALAGGSTGTLASMPVAGRIYILVLLLPSCLRMLQMNDDQLNLLGTLGLVFAAIMLNSHNNNYKLLRNTLTLTQDKEDLILQLSEKNQDILHANEDLERKVRERTKELVFLANHDPLTGLLNRRGFLSYPYRGPAARRHQTIIFIDLDHFKDINEGSGHEHGDLLLQAVSRRLTQVISTLAGVLAASDHAICRWGGDEFVICIMRDSDALATVTDTTLRYCQMHEQLSAPYQLCGHELNLGMSIGIFENLTDKDFDLSQALVFADIAASEAKKQGRGRVSFYSDAAHELQRRRLQLTNGLARAHIDGSLRLLFQPVIKAYGTEVASYEALLRWTHAELGPVFPDEFIPLAESSNAIVAIGLWVLEQACHEARQWPCAPGTAAAPKVAVNCSIRQLVQPDFVQLVQQTLANATLPPQRLIIEVTESVLDDRNMARALAALAALHDYGVEIHLDDFGTGYSSLSRLRQIPLDTIKIDKSFVIGMDDKSLAVIEATILIARKYGLRVIAEGVESAAHLATLSAMGVDELQGYYLGRPGEIQPSRT